MKTLRETLAVDWTQRQRHLHRKIKPAVRQQMRVLIETPMNLLIQGVTRQIMDECGVSERDATRSARALVREVLNEILEGQALGEFREDRHKTFSENRSHRGLAIVR